jgi:hypothetical protein
MNRPFNPLLRLKTGNLAAVLVTAAPILYFLPALLNGLVLAPDDGLLFNVPMRAGAAMLLKSGNLPLWNPYIFSGMPLFAAAQGGVLFPLNWFYLLFTPAIATNLMVVTTYMVAGCGAYLYARQTKISVAGAVVTSLAWQMGSFLIGQLSHINIVHTAALLPWVLLLIERYADTGSRVRGALLALVVAIQIFAGHQQTFAYTFLLVVAYSVVMAIGEVQLRKRYLWSIAFSFSGVLLAAVQILPTLELLRNSPRATATYDYFSSFSMPRKFVLTLLAPYLMGGGDTRLFRAHYVGQLYYTEYVAYAGIITLLLAVFALILKRDRRTIFWFIVLLVGFCLAFGRGAPLSLYRLIYYVPVLNLFRVPARHLVEVSFAISVLAGRGMSSLETLRGKPRVARLALILGGSAFLFTCLTVTLLRPANFALGRAGPVSLIRAPELFVPIIIAALSGVVVWLYATRRRGGLTLLLLVLVADLALWGQFSGWYKAAMTIPGEYWQTPEAVSLLREKASADPSKYRILTSHKTFDPKSAKSESGWLIWTEPDYYMMHGISNAAGYDGFGLDRYSRLAGDMKIWGELTNPNSTLRSDSREIDILNVRYLLARTEDAKDDESANTNEVAPESAFPVSSEKFGDAMFGQFDLGLPKLDLAKSLRFKVPPVEVDKIAFLTNLSWADRISDNTVVAKLRIKSKVKGVIEIPLRAGVETADWAYDRPDIRSRIKHRQPSIATNYDVTDAKYKYQGHVYVATVSLPEPLIVESGEIVLEGHSEAPDLSLSVFRISLINSGQGKSYATKREMFAMESLTSPTEQPTGPDERWSLLAQGKHFDIFENARALPRVYLASDAKVVDDETALKTIRTGTLPGGAKWNPLQTVLVSKAPAVNLKGTAEAGNAEVSGYWANRIDVLTQAANDSILVLSENDYPGWSAYVDGKQVNLLRVNYGLRGVEVPAGNHSVSVVYRSGVLLAGLIISLTTAFGLIVLTRVRHTK